MTAPAGAPTGLVVYATWQTIVTVVMFVISAVVLVLAARRPIRQHDWAELRFRLLVLIGGASGALFFEGAIDAAGNCWYAIPGQWGLIDLLGNHVQLWILGVYFWFVGGFALWIILQIRTGIQPIIFLKITSGLIAADLLLEVPVLRAAHLYAYYGANQPLFNAKWFPLPAWYLTSNALLAILPALLVLTVMSSRRRHIEWAIPFVMIAGCYTCYGSIAWPVVLAMHSGLSKLDTTLAALMTIGLGSSATYLAANLAPRLQTAMSWYGGSSRNSEESITAPLAAQVAVPRETATR